MSGLTQSLNLSSLQRLLLLTSLLSIFALPAAQAGGGNSKSQNYDIPAGPLSSALSQFAAEAGILLSSDAELTAGKTTDGLQGEYGISDGLNRLLSETGLEADQQADSSYVIRTKKIAKKPVTKSDETDKNQAANLDQITVQGTGDRLTYQARTSNTAMKIDTPIIETPASVQVVTEKVIEDQSAEELRDVLRNISGIQETGTFGNSSDNFNIRGFSARGILKDGYVTTSNRSLNANVERVEVLKGPASLLYGRLEPGGVINTVTKKPQFTFNNEVGVILSDSGTRRAQADFTGPLSTDTALGDFAYRLVMEKEDSNYWRNFGEIDRTFIAPSITWNYGNDRKMTLQYEYLDSTQPFDRGRIFFNGELIDTPPERRYGEPFEELGEEMHSFGLLLDHRITNNWRIEGKVSYQNWDSFDIQARPLGLTTGANGNPTGELIRQADGTRGRYSNIFYTSANLIGEIELLGLKNKVLIGLDYQDAETGRDEFIASPSQGGFNIFNPIYGQLDPSTAVATTPSDFTDNYETVGIYLQDTISLSEQWKLTLGGRFEDYEDFSRSNFGTVNPPNDNSEGDVILPRAALLYKPLESLSFYASYVESFQPNSVPVLPTSNQPIGSIDPQEGESYELGMKAQLGSGLNLTIALFDINKTNVTSTSLDANNNPVFTVSDEVTSRGLEVDLAGAITPNWEMIASYAYIDAEDPDSALEDRVSNVAEHAASLATSYRFTSGALRGADIGGGIYYVGKRYGGGTRGASGLQEAFFMEDYIVTDIYAGYSFQYSTLDGLRLRLGVSNLFDEEYIASSTSAIRVRPGQTRTVFGRIHYSF